MRTPSLIGGTVLVCGLALAARNETVVYTEGNLDGIAPNTNAVLDLSQDKAMKLRAGRTDVSVPYASITKGDAAADTAAVAAPGKKGIKAVEVVTVEFNSVQGEPRTMMLHMSKDGASRVLATIHKHSPADTKVASVDTTAEGSAPAAKTLIQTADQTPDKPADQAVAQAAPEAPAASQATDQQPKPVMAEKAAKQDQAKADKQAAKQAKADKKKQAKADKLAKNDKDKKKDEDHPGTAISDLVAKTPAKDNGWWGDSAWKTNTNLPKWQQQGGTAAAQ